MRTKKGARLAPLRSIAALASILLLANCGDAASEAPQALTDAAKPPHFFAERNPERLSEWNILALDKGNLHLAKRVVPYDLNTPLFTDYAHKLRTVFVPKGASARFEPTDTFDFPVGTIISKTFYYPLPAGASRASGKIERSADATEQRLAKGFKLDSVHLVETRILVHREDGWSALPYVWNEDQSDAVLKRTGAIEQLALVDPGGKEQPFSYVVPNANQCQGCHATDATTRKIHPIGPKARHLNKDFAYSDGHNHDGTQNQLKRWARLGILTGLPEDFSKIARNALWDDASFSLSERARSYLDINCSHCHNRNGPADTSGLFLEKGTADGLHLGRCKLPIAAGTGTGDRRVAIFPGRPSDSILVYRMESTNPSEMMPELGRSLAHREGVALISNWIAAMKGTCR